MKQIEECLSEYGYSFKLPNSDIEAYDRIEGDVPFGYYSFFFTNDHQNYVASHEIIGPIVVSIQKEDNIYRVLIRSSLGLKAFCLPVAGSSVGRNPIKNIISSSMMRYIEHFLQNSKEIPALKAAPISGLRRKLSSKMRRQTSDLSMYSRKTSSHSTGSQDTLDYSNKQKEIESLENIDFETLSSKFEAVCDLELPLRTLEQVDTAAMYNVDILVSKEHRECDKWSKFENILGKIVDKSEFIQEKFYLQRQNKISSKIFVKKPSEAIDSKANEQKRNNVINELIETEKSYVRKLKLVQTLYMDKLSASGKEQEPQNTENETGIFSIPSDEPNAASISPSEHSMIFGDIGQVIRVNEDFLNDLMQSSEIGKTILFHIKQFGVYKNYINFYSKSTETIKKCIEKNSGFKMFLDQARINPKSERNSLQDLLIMPIQRIPRYVLLLRDLIVSTSANSPDYSALYEAWCKLSAIGDYINEAKKRAEATQKMFEIQDMVDNCPPTLIRFPRWYMCKVDTKLKGTEYTLFLFNDRLLITKKVNSIFGGSALALNVKKITAGTKKPYKCSALLDVDNIVVKQDGRSIKMLVRKEKVLISKKPIVDEVHCYEFAVEDDQERKDFINTVHDAVYRIRVAESKSTIRTCHWRNIDFYFHIFDEEDYKNCEHQNDIVIGFNSVPKVLGKKAVGVLSISEESSKLVFRSSKNCPIQLNNATNDLFSSIINCAEIDNAPPFSAQRNKEFRKDLAAIVKPYQKTMMTKLRRTASFNRSTMMNKINPLVRNFSKLQINKRTDDIGNSIKLFPISNEEQESELQVYVNPLRIICQYIEKRKDDDDLYFKFNNKKQAAYMKIVERIKKQKKIEGDIKGMNGHTLTSLLSVVLKEIGVILNEKEVCQVALISDKIQSGTDTENVYSVARKWHMNLGISKQMIVDILLSHFHLMHSSGAVQKLEYLTHNSTKILKEPSCQRFLILNWPQIKK